jgi:hypothetical protein
VRRPFGSSPDSACSSTKTATTARTQANGVTPGNEAAVMRLLLTIDRHGSAPRPGRRAALGAVTHLRHGVRTRCAGWRHPRAPSRRSGCRPSGRQSLDGDATLGARQRCAGTDVRAVAERDVLACVWRVPIGSRRDARSAGDRGRLVVPGHHHHAVVLLALYRALRPQPREVGIRVGNELVATEEVDRVVIGRCSAPRCRARRFELRLRLRASRDSPVRRFAGSPVRRDVSIAGVVPSGPLPSGRGLLLARPSWRRDIAVRRPRPGSEDARHSTGQAVDVNGRNS